MSSSPRIVIAPDGFKESLTASAAAEAIVQGAGRACPRAELRIAPVADGGTGFLDALLRRGGTHHRAPVRSPCPPYVERCAAWGRVGGRGLIEAAAAVGLAGIPASARDPLQTSSFPLGQLLGAALDAGVDELVIGLGDSGCHDLGLGLLQALGARLPGASTPACGADLERLEAVEPATLDPRLRSIPITVACDVQVPLAGALDYAPQKGADARGVERLRRGTARLLERVGDPADAAGRPGAGAAGGLGFACARWLGAELVPGIELVLAALDFPALLQGADLVVTGEGRLDGQTRSGSGWLKLSGLDINKTAPYSSPKLPWIRHHFPRVPSMLSLTDSSEEMISLLTALHASVGRIENPAYRYSNILNGLSPAQAYSILKSTAY